MMMELIKNKIDRIHKLNDEMDKLSNDIDKFNKYNLKMNVDIINEISDIPGILKKIDNISYSIIIETSNIDFKSFYELWHLINLIIYKIKDILDEIEVILRNNTKYTDTFTNDNNITDTQMSFISDLYNNMINIYQKFQNDNTKLDIEIIQKLESIIVDKTRFSSNDIIDKIEIYTKLVKLYPYSINIYAFMMQTFLVSCMSLGNNICNIIIDNIESVKDFILLESVKTKLNTKITHKLNPHIKTFGLIPNGPSDTLANIINKVFKDQKIKNESSLELVSKKNNMCIVVLNRVISKPIEFSLWNLIDWNYSKPFLQAEFTGINKKMIDRFKTIKFIEIKKNQKWNFDIDHYGNLESDYFIIMEKLNDDVFRLLNVYDRDSDINIIKGGGRTETKIHKDHIRYFIEYVKNNGIISNNTRISKYHKLQEKKIIKKMFLPSKFNIKNINTKSQVVESKFLRYEMKNQLSKTFNEIIKKEYKDGSSIKTNKDIGTILHHSMLSDIFNSIILEQYDIYTFKNKENISTFPYSESLKTFIAEVNLLNRSFIRGIHNEFTSTKIDQTIFSENNVKKNTYLNKIFNDILDAVLLKMISDESNIYQSLIYKNALLDLSLI